MMVSIYVTPPDIDVCIIYTLNIHVNGMLEC